MIKFALAIAFELCISWASLGQVWCPPDAQWHYQVQFGSTNGYDRFDYVADTNFNGKAAKLITGSGNYHDWHSAAIDHYNLGSIFTAMENGVLYLWHGQGGLLPPYWDTLIWFSAIPGNHWDVLQPEDFACPCSYTVIDTGHITLAGMWLRYVQTSNDCGGPGNENPMFVERIGGFHGTFLDECQTGDTDTTLRCYQDDEITVITGIASTCNLIDGITVDQVLSPNAMFDAAPDEAGTTLELRFFSPTTSDLQLKLLDMSGRTLTESAIPRGATTYRISTTGLASGLHVVQVSDARNGCWAVKWVKE